MQKDQRFNLLPIIFIAVITISAIAIFKIKNNNYSVITEDNNEVIENTNNTNEKQSIWNQFIPSINTNSEKNNSSKEESNNKTITEKNNDSKSEKNTSTKTENNKTTTEKNTEDKNTSKSTKEETIIPEKM